MGKLGVVLVDALCSRWSTVVELCSCSWGSTMTLCLDFDFGACCCCPVESCVSPELSCMVPLMTDMSLTGTSEDPESVTVEGVIEACTGIVSPGLCLLKFVILLINDRGRFDDWTWIDCSYWWW